MTLKWKKHVYLSEEKNKNAMNFIISGGSLFLSFYFGFLLLFHAKNIGMMLGKANCS